VPVTTYQAYSCWEPVTTCHYPQQEPACPPVAAQTQIPLQQQPNYPLPGVNEQRQAPVPGVRENPVPGVRENRGSSNGQLNPQNYYPISPNGTSLQRLPVTPPAPVPASPPPKVKLENIVAVPVEPVPAQVVRNDKIAR
jgi:hypothetical protein